MNAPIDLVEALRQVVGVAAAKIIDDPQGVGTLQLALTDEADEISVAMEVNKVLRERFGLGVDPDRVEVIDDVAPEDLRLDDREEIARREAEFRNLAFRAETPVDSGYALPRYRDRPETLLPPVVALPDIAAQAAPRVKILSPTVTRNARKRLSIRRLQLVSSLDGVTTTVTLGMGPNVYVGRATAALDSVAVHRAVAESTLAAVRGYLADSGTVELECIEVAPVESEQVALVVVRLREGGTMYRLTGASVVREDARQAVIRATLDAVNRRVEAIMEKGREQA
ncbi:MAG: hypothetical protein NTU50_01945 [Actinobacteria bacterium]|nr:hypothetical protein [Actinomycetota bacterium]